jgi:hypothetical protein
MSVFIPITEQDFIDLTQENVKGIIDALNDANFTNDDAAVETYAGLLNDIVRKAGNLSLQNEASVISTISDFIIRYSDSFSGTYADLLNLKTQNFNGNVNNTYIDIVSVKQCTTEPILQLTNIRESKYYVDFSTNSNIDFNWLDNGSRGCRLTADLVYCCPAGPLTLTGPGGVNGPVKPVDSVKLIKAGVILAESQTSFWYEDCGTDGQDRRPVYQGWYDERDITNIFGWKTFAANGTVIPLERELQEYILAGINNDTISWGGLGGATGVANPCTTTHNADELDKYFQAVMFRALGRNAISGINIYNGDVNNVQRLSRSTFQNDSIIRTDVAVDGNGIRTFIGYGYKSGCFQKERCIPANTDCVTTEAIIFGLRDKLDAQGNKVPTIRQVLSRGTELVKIPGKPCYEGIRVEYAMVQPKERKFSILTVCPGKSPEETQEWRDDNSVENIIPSNIEVVYENVQPALLKNGDIKYPAECIGREVYEDAEPFVDKNDPCGCYEIYASSVYIQYPDYSTQGQPDYLQGIRVASKINYNGLGEGLKLQRKFKASHCIDDPVRVFHGLINTKDILTGRETKIFRGLFNTSQSLDCYYTSSTQNTASKEYYYEITDCESCGRTSYFGLAYGHYHGSGSLYSGYESEDTPTKAMYSQQRLSALEMPEKYFKFYTNGVVTESKDVYIINFNRDSFVHRLDPGNFEINLAELSGSGKINREHTGSKVEVKANASIVTLIDNSGDIGVDLFCKDSEFTAFDLVSGSLVNGIHSSGTGSNLDTYGIVYPSLGVLVIDPYKLNRNLGFNTVTGSNVRGDNAYKLHTAISGAAALGYKMKARNVEYKTTNHYFIRIGAATSNYSNNPTFVLDNPTTLAETGMFRHECFKTEPVTFVTTIGLYNTANELLAIAKLSKPIQKTQDTDVLVKIRLNW